MGSACSCFGPVKRTDVHHKIIRAKTPMSAKSKVEAFIRKMSSTSRELNISEILGSLPSLDRDWIDTFRLNMSR
jgi:hypothetical protein